jgi:CAAX prenyl protease-like protein
MVFQALALIVRAIVQTRLEDHGMSPRLAADLSFLLVPLVLLPYLLPGLRDNARFLQSQFPLRQLSVRLALTGVAVGILLRIAWWAQVLLLAVVRAGGEGPGSSGVDILDFACPVWTTLAAYLVAMALLAPLIEEIVHRGYVLEHLLGRGPSRAATRRKAIVISSILFALFHPPGGMWMAFVAGLLFAVLARTSGSLWAPVMAHATYNALIALDWLCLRISWTPRRGSGDTIAIAVLAGLCAAMALLASLRLIRSAAPDPCRGPAPRPMPRTP